MTVIIIIVIITIIIIIIIVIIRYSRGNETFAGGERFAAKVCEFADPLR